MRLRTWAYLKGPYTVRLNNITSRSNVNISDLKFPLFTLILSVLSLNSCGVYTFTGTTITAETLQIDNFYSEITIGPPNLEQTFTNNLRDYFQQNTNLTLVDTDGELFFEGGIIDYRLSPIAPTASGSDQVGDQAALTRLTITVNVVYANSTDDAFDFDRNFSFYADYDSDLGLTTVEEQLIEEIFDQIILDIFNASVANW